MRTIYDILAMVAGVCVLWLFVAFCAFVLTF